MWRVVDTAKAVFNVDNYKEYLSLQCDSALRNIVRIYPYDVAPGVDTVSYTHLDVYKRQASIRSFGNCSTNCLIRKKLYATARLGRISAA